MGIHLCSVEDTFSVVSAGHSKLSVVKEVGSGDETGHFVPHGHLLHRDVSQSEFPVQGSTQEVPIILEHEKKSVKYICYR